MPIDDIAVAHAFVSALVSNVTAREAFTAAMHPVDPVHAASIINQYASPATPVVAADIEHLVPLIGAVLAEARASGAADITGNVMPGDAGDEAPGIVEADSGATTMNVMRADGGDKPN